MSSEEILNKYWIAANDGDELFENSKSAMEEYAQQEVASNTTAIVNIILQETNTNELLNQSLTIGEIQDIIRLALKQESIAFLDSIRNYIHESHCNISQDERASEELYLIYKQQTK